MTILIGIAACQKPEKLIYSDESGMPLTRSITPTVSPVFDWWDTTSISLLGINSPVTLPWYNGASTQIPNYMLDNYKPEDGWKMIYNYCIDTPPGEEGKYYLMFYTSNPQPIGFSGILLAKRQNSFYCTYFLHNRNVADTKSPYPIKRLEVIRWFNQKSMVFNQSLS